jgi:hypothetical protein
MYRRTARLLSGKVGPMSGSELDIFVGQWTMTARFPGDVPAGGAAARSVFEWILDGKYLVQRTEISVPGVPDSMSVVAARADGQTYTQHYYDSRGVTRLYAMTFADGVWTLTREAADFSPLDFRQRFVGTFSADGNQIDGAWETGTAGGGWKLDFEVTYTRVALSAD